MRTLEGDSFTLYDLNNALKGRSFGVLLLLMALPNAFLVASIPGLSSFFGVALIFISLQMILRREKAWFPKFLGEKVLSKTRIDAMLTAYNPRLTRIENNLKFRWRFLTSAALESILGFVCLIHALLIALPIPLGNFLPGVALVFLALGVIAKDGLFILIGYTLSLLVFTFFAASFFLVFKATQGFFG